MKILCLHRRRLDSGKANLIQVLHMCSAFGELGEQVTLALPSSGLTRGRIKEEVETILGKKAQFEVCPYDEVSLGGKFSMLAGCLGMRKALRNRNPDCCFIRSFLLLNFTLARKIPTVIEQHNAACHPNPLLNWLLTRNLVRNARCTHLRAFIAISRNLADYWIEKGVPAEKMLVLHDGVDVESFQHAPDRSELRRKLDLPMNKTLVLYAGSLYVDRGVDRLIDLAKQFPDSCFVAIGGPQERATALAEQADDENARNVMFLGAVPHSQVKEYLMAADVLLMLWTRKVRTINYCSPLKVFEYMAAGKIIVGDGFPTIREVLTDGESALLSDPDSFESLKEKVSQALRMDMDSPMARRARDLAADKFSWLCRAQSIRDKINT